VYVIAGGGEDFTRLQEKVQALGILNNIRFTGMVQEEEKADLYNLADVFVMPGHGEGFGIVFLEAMACGIPVVGSELDGSREALRGGTLGIVVNPLDPSSIEQGIREAFMRGKGVPEGLDHFAEPQFEHRVRTVVDDVITDQLMTETRA
jgi:glycosyltransferase involved in cell wall biosynthesis